LHTGVCSLHYTRMQAAYERMQAACIPSVNPALRDILSIGYQYV